MLKFEKYKKIVTVRYLAFIWLVFILSFFLGMYVVMNKAWPYSIVKEVERFVTGDEEEKTTIKQKIQNDLNIKPSRHIIKRKKGEISISNYRTIDGLPLNSRRKRPLLYMSPKAPRGFRVLHGVFDFDKTLTGVILLGPDGKVLHTWRISAKDVESKRKKDIVYPFPHGFEIAPDGSILTAFDNNERLIKYDYNSNVVWGYEGDQHHTLTFNDDYSAVWGLEKHRDSKEGYFKLDYMTGGIITSISRKEMINKNPNIDIFGMRQHDGVDKSKWVKKGGGVFHTNDVDPLPKSLEKYYPNFKAGDLLISMRSINLIFVVDPGSLIIKWWRQGQFRRQHDPDWNNRGTITVFDNNMHRQYSRIVEVNPRNYNYKVLVDGKKLNFYSRIRGKHQELPNGNFLITSTQQGRVFEVDKNGDIVFEFLNYYGENDNMYEFLVISEAKFLPMNFFNEGVL